MNGVIKKLTDRGFGFIGAEGESKDIFFHSKSLVGIEYGELREGDEVVFEIEMVNGRPAATSVQLASKESLAA
jgi:cold shock CspA family protein